MAVYPHTTGMFVTDSNNSTSNYISISTADVVLSSCNNASDGNSFQIAPTFVNTTICTGSLRIIDDRATTLGLEYAADYRTGFTNCSLVTKEYVDDSTGAIGGENGLSKDGDNIVLGGVHRH